MYNDGGRAAAGYKGRAGDCVVRAIAIAVQKPYQEVYDAINALALEERARRGRTRSSSRSVVGRVIYERYLKQLGWEWVPTMKVGSSCRAFAAKRPPKGRILGPTPCGAWSVPRSHRAGRTIASRVPPGARRVAVLDVREQQAQAASDYAARRS
jgi:hypothetical protein